MKNLANSGRKVGRRMGQGMTAATLAVVGVIALVVPSFASTTDPLGGVETSKMNSIVTWVTTYGLPLVFTLLVVGIAAVLAVKFIKRGARSS